MKGAESMALDLAGGSHGSFHGYDEVKSTSAQPTWVSALSGAHDEPPGSEVGNASPHGQVPDEVAACAAAEAPSHAVLPRHFATTEENLEDTELVQRVSQRDVNAFEILYERYHTPLRRFISRVDQRIQQDVEEVINDVMMVVWQKAGTFNGTSKVSTWIMGIAYNKALSAGSQWRGAAEVDYDDVADTLPGIADQGLQDYELQDWLSAALDRLSPEQRAVMELTCNQGMHYGEIAEILGCPENTVKTRMFHSRRKLRQIIDAIGLIGD